MLISNLQNKKLDFSGCTCLRYASVGSKPRSPRPRSPLDKLGRAKVEIQFFYFTDLFTFLANAVDAISLQFFFTFQKLKVCSTSARTCIELIHRLWTCKCEAHQACSASSGNPTHFRSHTLETRMSIGDEQFYAGSSGRYARYAFYYLHYRHDVLIDSIATAPPRTISTL